MFPETRIVSVRDKVGRFSFFLLSILLLFALQPFLEPFVRVSILSEAFFSLVMLSGIRAISYRKRDFVLSLSTGIPALLLGWAAEILRLPVARVAASSFGALFIALALILILSHVNKQREVTRDVVMGAVCSYFLIGIVWVHLYFLLESGSPGAFSLPRGLSRDPVHFIYYSFITLTTVGYGDILPVSNPARSLAVLEAMVGQMYLAVAMARLVAIHISQTQGVSEK
ncbi:MAG: hypothetical protein CVU57_22965 [Deltaproteobacteria bacterium HGW-Deltaproteobacteria-15]|jgi:hypothetical protein|nr:MAG: hypothetical protein CVU57_22965 [Deltaproteobacteria bacterium HGW-Deltaproteobacteria-15]